MLAENAGGGGTTRFGPFEFDLDTVALSRDGHPIDLATLPSRVLSYLIEHRGRIVSREELRSEIWGEDLVLGFNDRLNTCVATIRSALGDDATQPTYIETLRGRGYRFIAPVGAPEPVAPRRRYTPLAAVAAVVILGAVTLSAVSDAGPSAEVFTPMRSADPLSPMTTEDLEAWSLYLRASALMRNMREADYREAAALLEEAVERDPTFALGHAGLAIAGMTLSWSFADGGHRSRADVAARRAVELAPDHAGTWHALGMTRYYGWRDYDGALEALLHAVEIDPVNPEILSAAGWVLRRLGDWEASTLYLSRAAALDPYSLEIHRSLGHSYARHRDYAAARQHLDLTLSLAPRHAGLYLDLAEVALLSGDGAGTALEILRLGAERTSIEVEDLILGSPLLTRVVGDRIPVQFRAVSHPESPREDTADAGRAALAAAWLKDAQGDRAAALRLYASVRERILRGEAERGMRGLSEERANLALAAAGLGMRSEALRYAQMVRDSFPIEWDAMQAGYLHRIAAEALVLAGEHDLAIDRVAELLEIPSPVSPALLRIDPIWDPVRENPRFQELAGIQ